MGVVAQCLVYWIPSQLLLSSVLSLYTPPPPPPPLPPLQMLLYLKEFSQKMVGKTHEIERQVDTLVGEARATDTRVNNVYNDFLMLSNIQFVESVSFFFFLLLPPPPLFPFSLPSVSFPPLPPCYLTNPSCLNTRYLLSY